MVPRRWARLGIRLAVLLTILALVVFIGDVYMDFLPSSIQQRLPLHSFVPVVVDIAVFECLRASSCQKAGWRVIPKDLYLGSSWLYTAHLFIREKPETVLEAGELVVLDVAIVSNPKIKIPEHVMENVIQEYPQVDESDDAKTLELAKSLGWRVRDRGRGLWLKYGRNVPGKAVSEVKILFGQDALYPLDQWTLVNDSLSIGSHEPRMVFRTGAPVTQKAPALKVNSNDGTFKIVQLADLHMSTDAGKCDHPEPQPETGETCLADARTLELVLDVLDEELPDLVIYTGDQIFGSRAPDVETAILKAVGPAISRGIPWAAVFGNHDSEETTSREEQMEIMSALPYSLAQSGPENVTGVGNYVLTLPINGNAALTMYMLDSHSDIKVKGRRQYDWIREDQLEWLKSEYRAIQPKQQAYAHIPLSMAFFHIPLPEYSDSSRPRLGQAREKVMSPGYHEPVLDILRQVGVKVLSVGHDHCNDFCQFMDGSDASPVWLCYGGGGGFGGYGGYPDSSGKNYERRIRVFEVDTLGSSVRSWKRVQGEKEPIDRQTLIKNGAPVWADIGRT